MSLRDNFDECGIDVSHLSDAQLEQVAIDAVAEFGDRTPDPYELETILARYSETPEPDVAYIPRATWREILAFEKGVAFLHITKARAIRETFGFTPGIYQLLLNRALDDPAALLEEPELVGDLIAERARRREARVGV